jgi:type IV secretory pathway VirB6-like protein
MFGLDNTGSDLDTVAHIIQVALTPVFLLSGIATLLNVFSTRLARVADRVDAVSKALEGADPDEAKALAAQLAYLHRRSLALDLAVVLGAVGGAATCGAVLALFVGALREATIASVLFALFGLAILCALGAICAFTAEMLIASRGIRGEAAASRPTGPG